MAGHLCREVQKQAEQTCECLLSSSQAANTSCISTFSNEEAAWSTRCGSEAGVPAQAYLEGAQVAADRHVRCDKLPQQNTV